MGFTDYDGNVMSRNIGVYASVGYGNMMMMRLMLCVTP